MSRHCFAKNQVCNAFEDGEVWRDFNVKVRLPLDRSAEEFEGLNVFNVKMGTFLDST